MQQQISSPLPSSRTLAIHDDDNDDDDDNVGDDDENDDVIFTLSK